MINNFRCGILALLLLTQVGCTIAKYPIDEKPVVRIDSSLLGKWKTTDKKDVYTMTRKSDYEYMLSVKEHGKRHPERIPAFLSVINNERFLNFAQIENDTLRGYSFARVLTVDPAHDKITCILVEDTMLEKMNSSSEVRNYILKNMNRPSFYKDTSVFDRVK